MKFYFSLQTLRLLWCAMLTFAHVWIRNLGKTKLGSWSLTHHGVSWDDWSQPQFQDGFFAHLLASQACWLLFPCSILSCRASHSKVFSGYFAQLPRRKQQKFSGQSRILPCSVVSTVTASAHSKHSGGVGSAFDVGVEIHTSKECGKWLQRLQKIYSSTL